MDLSYNSSSKMESFIRSKYESRRWAKEGPPPPDPSILESGLVAASTSTTGSACRSISGEKPPFKE